jgi:leader peptidase (prepilin peptidase) / N-methyltransferase
VGINAGSFEIALLTVAGATVGSFLNVVAYRLPRGLSVVRPRSRCPGCGAQIAGYDNVPVVSWVLLRGRCRACDETISFRYPLIEAVSAALFAGVAIRADSLAEVWPGLALVATLVVVAVIDLEYRIVPNRVLAPAAVAALALWALADPGRLPENLAAAAAAGGFLLLLALAYPAGMGMGDVKLAAVMGLFLGRSVAPALLAGFALGAAVGVGILMARGASARKQAIPFAPFLAVGGVVGQLFGPEIIDWYLGLT